MNKSREMIHASRLLDLLREMKLFQEAQEAGFIMSHRKKAKSTFFAGSCIFCMIWVDDLVSEERSDDDDDADAEVSREGVDTETAESAVRCQSWPAWDTMTHSRNISNQLKILL